jgi:drug/metabolite transporter (DMT)-like permease
MTQKNSFSRFAPLLIILGGSCWGIIGLFTKNLTAAGCTPIQITFIRSAFSAILLWLFLLIFDRKQLKIRFRDIWMFLGSGILSLALFSILYFSTQQTANLSVAAVLLYTAPCFVMVMSAIFFKEKITGRKAAALILAFIGCACITGLVESLVWGTCSISLSAILTGIGSGLGYALYSIFGNVALRRYSTVTLTAYTMLFSALALLPFSANSMLFKVISTGNAPYYVIGITLFSTILPYLLYSQGLKYTEPGRASVMAFSEPVVATLTGIIAFHEKLTVGGIVGAVLIFSSIVLLNTGLQKKLEND